MVVHNPDKHPKIIRVWASISNKSSRRFECGFSNCRQWERLSVNRHIKKRTVRVEPLKKELLCKIKGGVRFPERVAIVGNEKT